MNVSKVNGISSVDTHSVIKEAKMSENKNERLSNLTVEGIGESTDDVKSENNSKLKGDFEFENQENNFQIGRSLASNVDEAENFSEDQNKLKDSDHVLLSQHHDCDALIEAKLHHEKESLSYKHKIDELLKYVNFKVEETKDLISMNHALQEKYEQLQTEKSEYINKMSEEFAAHKKYQLFLESGVIEEIKQLKIQVQQLEEENSLLKIEAKDLTLKAFELQNKFELLQNERNEWIDKMSLELAAQKKCQLFLESSVIEGINELKLQVQLLEGGNSLGKESFLRHWMRFVLTWIPFSRGLSRMLLG